jgi:hypothetical protein
MDSGTHGSDGGAVSGGGPGVAHQESLSEDEIPNVLAIVRTAFEKPERIPQAARDPSRTLGLLQTLADSTDRESLKQQIAETIAYVHAH